VQLFKVCARFKFFAVGLERFTCPFPAPCPLENFEQWTIFCNGNDRVSATHYMAHVDRLQTWQYHYLQPTGEQTHECKHWMVEDWGGLYLPEPL
jgi:hypothetical protein